MRSKIKWCLFISCRLKLLGCRPPWLVLLPVPYPGSGAQNSSTLYLQGYVVLTSVLRTLALQHAVSYFGWPLHCRSCNGWRRQVRCAQDHSRQELVYLCCRCNGRRRPWTGPCTAAAGTCRAALGRCASLRDQHCWGHNRSNRCWRRYCVNCRWGRYRSNRYWGHNCSGRCWERYYSIWCWGRFICVFLVVRIVGHCLKAICLASSIHRRFLLVQPLSPASPPIHTCSTAAEGKPPQARIAERCCDHNARAFPLLLPRCSVRCGRK